MCSYYLYPLIYDFINISKPINFSTLYLSSFKQSNNKETTNDLVPNLYQPHRQRIRHSYTILQLENSSNNNVYSL